uniref:IgA peptidase M64 n=1 Tax=Kwoniella dejecticola CBS 10117 TaxID=1296121 RepID=A0A1A6A3S7_9TREE|nr:uncharacterized protein I303_05572 [Kwoniella dejecticola CBS 10117]OBR84713.1 hypothetical protein I303_05572 [Kwoniella dejecticola CBS 10117]
MTCISARVDQLPFQHGSDSKDTGLRSAYDAVIDHPLYPPRINYAKLDAENSRSSHIDGLPNGMITQAIHVSEDRDDRVDLMFFSDGYTIDEFDKFVSDVQYLKDDIISPNGSMGHVVDLLNIWATFIPSNQSGIGTHGRPLAGSPLGLYRPGSELRAVYVKHPKIARKVCKWFREGHADEAGCDQAILLGNDPLYGGLGGEFTIITASKLNGPQVLRHELGHSLISVGEEYDGGFVYSGVNAEKVEHLDNLKWRRYLSDPDDVRIEDARMAVQAYPWHDLDNGKYMATFTSANDPRNTTHTYSTALLRTSLSSIPDPSHIIYSLNDEPLDLSAYFPEDLKGSLDRRWLDISLLSGLKQGENRIEVHLRDIGKRARAGQGGKMITSLEIIEYGDQGRFNHTLGHIGAYPTFSMKGRMTLRPTNEQCLMRNVTHPRFCPVCVDALRESLQSKIARKKTKDNVDAIVL